MFGFCLVIVMYILGVVYGCCELDMCKTYPKNITQEMRDCVGVYWEPRTQELVEVRWDDFIKSPGIFLKSIMLEGRAGAGKSALMHQFLRRCGVMREKDFYIYGKTLDPLGTLSKSGTLLRCGGIGITDFEPVSKLDHKLTEEEVKGLLSVEDGGSFGCRYAPAVLAKGLPRIFAINNSPTLSWYAEHNIKALDALSTRDVDFLTRASDGMQAQARRTVIFKCPDIILNDTGRAKLMEQTQRDFNDGMARLSALGME